MYSSLLDYYRAIENASAEMLAAARTDDWDEVVRLESTCAVLIEQLRLRARQADLAPEERVEKKRLMMTILRHDAQIRDLIEPSLDEIDRRIFQKPALH